MNTINIVATITKPIELKYTPSGTCIANFSIAYNEKYKKQDGSYEDKAHFFDVVAFGKKGEVLSQFFQKGSRIGITGSLNYESWQNDQGQTRSKVNIKLNDFTFIDRKQDNAGQQPQQPQQNYQQQNQASANYAQPQQQYQQPTINVDQDEIIF
jgi:single-strand DNA-binding protein